MVYRHAYKQVAYFGISLLRLRSSAKARTRRLPSLSDSPHRIISCTVRKQPKHTSSSSRQQLRTQGEGTSAIFNID